MTVIIHNPKRSRWVRIVTWLLLIFAAGFVAGGVLIAQTYGLNPADGGVLKPLAVRMGFGGAVAAIGILIGGGMWLYGTLYVSELVQEGNALTVETLSLSGTSQKEHAVGDITGGSFYHGRMRQPGIMTQTINAPWLTLRVKGKWLPYIIDGQADEINVAALEKLNRKAMQEWKKDLSG